MKKIKFLFILLIGLGFSACEDKLELEPAQSLSTTEALSDLASLQTALYGAYDGMQTVNYYGRNYLVIPEITGDQVYLSINNSNRFVLEYTYQFVPSSQTHGGYWNTAYTVILRVNNIINLIDDAEGDAAKKNQIKGEALAIRALAHFDLVRVFAKQYTNSNPATDLGVPVILESKIDEPARNTIEEVYAQVIKDLSDAKALIGDAGTYRFSKNAVEALLARVYLYKGDWAKAEASATAIISSGKYSLATDILKAFEAPGSSEEIFTLKYLAAESFGSDNLGQIYNPAGYGDIRVASDLIDLYEPADQRLGFIYKHTTGQNHQRKFFVQDGIPGMHSPKLLRLAELYLIRAEARAKQNKFADAVADLNAIREKRGASVLSGIADANVLQAVYDERNRELAFEGHTAFDLWRTGRDMVRNQCNTGVELSAPCEIKASSPFTVFPIPQRELDVNQNMVQNPGY